MFAGKNHELKAAENATAMSKDMTAGQAMSAANCTFDDAISAVVDTREATQKVTEAVGEKPKMQRMRQPILPQECHCVNVSCYLRSLRNLMRAMDEPIKLAYSLLDEG
jgi:hypothetical protein